MDDAGDLHESRVADHIILHEDSAVKPTVEAAGGNRDGDVGAGTRA